MVFCELSDGILRMWSLPINGLSYKYSVSVSERLKMILSLTTLYSNIKVIKVIKVRVSNHNSKIVFYCCISIVLGEKSFVWDHDF